MRVAKILVTLAHRFMLGISMRKVVVKTQPGIIAGAAVGDSAFHFQATTILRRPNSASSRSTGAISRPQNLMRNMNCSCRGNPVPVFGEPLLSLLLLKFTVELMTPNPPWGDRFVPGTVVS